MDTRLVVVHARHARRARLRRIVVVHHSNRLGKAQKRPPFLCVVTESSMCVESFTPYWGCLGGSEVDVRARHGSGCLKRF